MPEPVYLVRLKSGLVVRFTRAEYEALWKGCDPLACKVLGAPEGWEWKGWEWKGLSYEC